MALVSVTLLSNSNAYLVTTETEKKITRNGKGRHQPLIVTVDVHGFQVSVRSFEFF